MLKSSVEYRELQEFPGYRFGSDGTVWSCWKRQGKLGEGRGTIAFISNVWQELVQTKSGAYYNVSLKPEVGPCYTYSVGALILTAFVGPRPEGQQVCHGPKGKVNNSVGNLRWGTRQENMADKFRDGTDQRGERHSKAKLTVSDVMMIREIGRTVPLKVLAKQYGVTKACICQILLGQHWGHV